MTDDDKALVDRLLDFLHSDDVFAVDWKDIAAAAEGIEALSAKLAEVEAILELQSQYIGRMNEENARLHNWLNLKYQKIIYGPAALGDTK